MCFFILYFYLRVRETQNSSISMDKLNLTPEKTVSNGIKIAIKRNIAKAWYNLDKQSYESWLEGRRASQSELNF